MANEKHLSKLALIETLKKCSPMVRGRMLNYLNPEALKVLSEVIFNVQFNENIFKNLSKSEKRRLRKEFANDKEILFEISRRRGSYKKKRKLLKQTGGNLGLLLSR